VKRDESSNLFQHRTISRKGKVERVYDKQKTFSAFPSPKEEELNAITTAA
jgi:hypothetical protein